MLTPVEMQGKELKSGVGYQKKSIDVFLEEVFQDYEALYRENMELKDKISVLSDGLQYYKDLEKTLQKTLVAAEKAAEETTAVSQKKAESMEEQARLEAEKILSEANRQKQDILNEITREKERMVQEINVLKIKYESYMIQCRQNLMAQMEFFDSQIIKTEPEILEIEAKEAEAEMEMEEAQEPKKEATEEIKEEVRKEIKQEIKQEEIIKRETKVTKELEEDDIFDFVSFRDDEK